MRRPPGLPRAAAGALLATLAACGGRPAAQRDTPGSDSPAAGESTVAHPAAPAVPATPARMTPSLDSSATLFHAYQTGYAEPTRLAIRDRAAWEGAWARLHRGGGAPPVPAVDFARDMVLLVALGERPSGGHDVSVDAVTPDAAGGATVAYTAREPGEGCMSTQALTSPAVAVRAPRVAGDVRFDGKTERTPC